MVKTKKKKTFFKRRQPVLVKQPKRDRITFCTLMSEPFKVNDDTKKIKSENAEGFHDDVGKCYSSRGKILKCSSKTLKEIDDNLGGVENFSQIRVLDEIGQRIIKIDHSKDGTGENDEDYGYISNLMTVNGLSMKYVENFMRCDGRLNNAKYDGGYLLPVAGYFEMAKDRLKEFNSKTALIRRVYKRRYYKFNLRYELAGAAESGTYNYGNFLTKKGGSVSTIGKMASDFNSSGVIKPYKNMDASKREMLGSRLVKVMGARAATDMLEGINRNKYKS